MSTAPKKSGYLVGIYTEEDKTIERAIVETLQRVEPWRPSELMEEIRESHPGVAQNTIREAIWRLIDRDKIELTKTRKLKLYVNGNKRHIDNSAL